MANFSDVSCSNIMTLFYLDGTNVYDNTIYVPYDNIPASTFTKLFGISVCGTKDAVIQNRAIFYLFGGNDGDGTVYNDLIKITVDVSGGGPVVYADETIDCTSPPSGRYFSSVKIIGDELQIYGGIDVNGNQLSDIYKLSLDTFIQTEVTATGDTPAAKTLFGGLG